MEFQINTRLNPRSATNKWVPSLVTDVGLAIMLASAAIAPSTRLYCPPLVKFGWPRTRLAGWLLEVGIELQMRMRLLPVSATNSILFWNQTPWGLRSELALGEVDKKDVKFF